MVKKVAVIDLWTDDNRGDAALQLSLARLLRERFPDAELVGVYRFGFNEIDHVGREIAYSSKEFDVILGGPRLTNVGGADSTSLLPGQNLAFQLYSLARFSWVAGAFRLLGQSSARLMSAREFAALAASRDADLVVWKGKNFREYDSMTTFVRSVTQSATIVPALLFRKKILCVNASFWDIKNPLAAFVYRQVMSRCEYIVVREAESLRCLRKLVPEHRGISQAPDLSFKLMGDIHRRFLREGRALSEREFRVALTVTEWGTSAQQANYVAALVAVLAKLAQLGASSVVIVPQVIRKREDNSKLIERLLGAAPSSLKLEVLERELTIEELVEAYAGCRLLIGARMHSCVFARAAGTPFVAIAYDEGSKWAILSQFWPKELICNYSSLVPHQLVEAVSYLLEHGAVAIQESEQRFSALSSEVDAEIPQGFGAPA